MIAAGRHSLWVLLYLVFAGNIQAYRDVPALVYLNKLEQPDTIGFNLVDGMCSLLYSRIMDGSVPLYVSPEKALRIDANSLQALENTSGTRFEACPDLFIHEYWSSSRKSTRFKIEGFSFVNKNQLNEKVAFGFVSLKDIDSLLSHSFISTSANGSYHVSFEQALMSRKYSYHLVQMGQEAFFSDPMQAVKLKYDAFHSGKEIRSQQIIPAYKQLTYQVVKKKYSTDIDWSNSLILAVEEVLNENPELFMNLGGQRYDSFPAKHFHVPEVRGLLIEEDWVKTERQAHIAKARIKIILINGDLHWIELSDLERYGIVLHYRSLRDILSEKPFEFDLFRINDQKIDPALGRQYFEGIKKAPWNQLNAYVSE
ncbi:MAG TPA: hypothetical protein DIW47_00840 [Bacteroidetes bacterium]|nr:hypothetical protein [Bacteroidota bacterium]